MCYLEKVEELKAKRFLKEQEELQTQIDRQLTESVQKDISCKKTEELLLLFQEFDGYKTTNGSLVVKMSVADYHHYYMLDMWTSSCPVIYEVPDKLIGVDPIIHSIIMAKHVQGQDYLIRIKGGIQKRANTAAEVMDIVIEEVSKL